MHDASKGDCLHCRLVAEIYAHFAERGVIDHDEVVADVAFLLTEFLAAAEGDRMGLARRITRDIVKAVPKVRAGGNYPGADQGAALGAFNPPTPGH